MELGNIRGIGPKALELLNKLDIYTIEDLPHHVPWSCPIVPVHSF